MFQCSFMFTRIHHDEEFQTLDDAIAEYARSLEGFVGSDTWFNADSSQVNGVYFFETMDAVRTFAAISATPRGQREICPAGTAGYHVVISEVQATYGDGNFPHVTATGPLNQLVSRGGRQSEPDAPSE
jgi:hypothetical protein